MAYVFVELSDVIYCFRNNDRGGFPGSQVEAARSINIRRHQIGPFDAVFSILDAFFEYLYGISPLHRETDQREYIYDKKGGCED